MHRCFPSFSGAGPSTVQEPVLHDVRVGNGNLDILDLLPGEETKLLGFFADPHLGLFGKIQTVDHYDHPPDAAVPVGGNTAGIIVDIQFLEPVLGNPQTLVESKWGNYYDGLSAEKGEIEWRETVQGHSCDGCYDGGCGGPDFDIYKYRIVKISPEEYEKEKSAAVASGVAVESTGLGERFWINNENRYGITYMKNFQNLSGCYRYYRGS